MLECLRQTGEVIYVMAFMNWGFMVELKKEKESSAAGVDQNSKIERPTEKEMTINYFWNWKTTKIKPVTGTGDFDWGYKENHY